MNRKLDRFAKGSVGAGRQKGVVLFFALIALVVISLAAITLIRTVDTATLIAGNVAFKQAATSSGDSGVETAIGMLQSIGTPADLDNFGQAAHAGYYNSLNRNKDVTHMDWDNSNSAVLPIDNAGNTVRYIVQRMCNHPAGNAGLDSGQVIAADETNCIFSVGELPADSKRVRSATDTAPPLPTIGSPIYRVTAQVSGPRNTVSYVQAFVY